MPPSRLLGAQDAVAERGYGGSPAGLRGLGRSLVERLVGAVPSMPRRSRFQEALVSQSSVPLRVESNSAARSRDCLAHVYGNAGNRPYRQRRYPSDLTDAELAEAPRPAGARGHETGDSASPGHRRLAHPCGRAPDEPVKRPAAVRHPAVSCSSGKSGSASLSRLIFSPERTRRWIASLTSQMLTFMPARTRPSANQKAMNSRLARSPRTTTSS